ncbi:MAG: asparaginase [Magnetococcales bacterium]|nr:asparaginase [Magnetococcales bacterium]
MRILIVLTGGTIGSESGANGLRPANPEHQAEIIAALIGQYVNVNNLVLIVQQVLNSLSENFHPTDWGYVCSKTLTLAKFHSADGVLILHGTDTLAYSAAALSFYEPLSKHWPVVISGANKPMTAIDSDGPINVSQSISTLEYLIDNKLNGCFVVFNGTGDPDKGKIFLASRIKKFSWAGYCFRNFNLGDHSWIGEVQGCNVALNHDFLEIYPCHERFPSLMPEFASDKIEFYAIHPGFDPVILESVAKKEKIVAVLLAIYNSGTGPVQGLGSILKTLSVLREHDKLIFAVSQHEGEGGMQMNIYETSHALRAEGMISLHDMMMESAIPKLMLAAGNFSDRDDIRRFMNTNLAGELFVGAGE